ncbi:MAG TPA: DUF1501 domain-containing protein [Bacteroidia bacterium]|jgi:uncharacterized protein (DUF1501 family)|nr:DUF1501 domain-containing protein [Bacteroidia bacterium]
MNRRRFIKTSALASSYLLLPEFLKPLEKLNLSDTGEKNLVIVQLSGGNDWLNTIVPFNNDVYFQKRSKLALRNDKIITLNNELALNSGLSALKEFYDDGNLCIVNNVGYPNPDRSHFRSMDIWQSASSSIEYWNTGWIGRYLDSNCQNAYQAIEVDSALSLALKGERLKGIAVKDVKKLFDQTKLPYFKDIVDIEKKETLNEDNQGYLYKTLIETYSSAGYIYETTKTTTNDFEYPNTNFAKQLKNVATFIESGLNTRVYYVSLTGFDTHVAQLNQHEKLLQTYAEGISAFIKNLRSKNKWDNTLLFTFSEFGRRVEENASAGTDHGTAGNVLLFGGNLKKKGIVNDGPDLKYLDDGDLKFKVDFRSIYSNILSNWLNTDAAKILKSNIVPFELI